MQISKKFQQNVIFYAIILWQKDLKADKVSMPSWSLFTTITLSLKYFFKCRDLLPHKAGFDTSQRHSHALRKLEIHFPPKDGLGMFCPVGTFLTSLTLSNPPAIITSADGGSFVLLTLPVSSSSKGMEVVLSLGCGHVFSASVWLC